MSLNVIPFSGANNYAGLYVGTPVDLPDDAKAAPKSDFVRFFASIKPEHIKRPTEDSHDKHKHNKTVETVYVSPTTDGSPVASLYCSAVTDDGSFPAGMKIEVTRPDGTTVSSTDQPNPNEYATFDNQGNLTSLVVSNPMTGAWIFKVKVDPSITDAHFYAATVPTAEVEQTIQSTLGALLDPNKIAGDLLKDTSSFGCWICRVGLYILAAILAVLTTALIALITPEFPPVIALAATIGTNSPWITGLAVAMQMTVTDFAVFITKSFISLVSSSIALIAALICALISSCAPSIDVSIKSPKTRDTVSGTINVLAKADNGTTRVDLFVDGNLAGSSLASPFAISWDTTKVSNGNHILMLFAYSSNATAQSQGVGVTVQNTPTLG